MPSIVEQARNRYAVASKLHGPGSSEAEAARADLAATKIEAFVARVVADSPP